MSLTNTEAGLQVDANTVALYKSIREFDPPLGIGIHESGDGTIADATGNYPLQANGTARIGNGPLGAAGAIADPPQFSRTFCSNLSGFVHGVSNIDQDYNDAIRQTFTQQFLIKPEWPHTAARGIYGANNDVGSGSGNDWLARIHILSDGNLSAFWENNDTNTSVNTTALTLAIAKWQVVTVVWNAGTGYAIDFYVHELNGSIVTETYQESFGDMGTLPNSASGLGDSRITYGRTDRAGNNGEYIGQIAFGRIYKGALTPTEIADQAEELLLTGTLATISDANDLHRHEFNEPPDWIDEAPYGLHANSGAIVDYDTGKKHIDLVGSGGRARRNASQAMRIGHLSVDETLEAAFGPDRMSDFFNDSFVAVPEYTFQWIGLWRDGGSNFIAQWEDDSESLATNFLFRYDLNPAAGDVGFFAERGSGTNIGRTNVVTTSAFGTDLLDQTMLVTVRAGDKPGSPGTMQVRVSINDQLDVITYDLANVPQGGTGGVGINWGWIGAGYLQEFKWSFGMISDQQIEDDFARILDTEGTAPPADEVAPIITNLSPPASTLINSTDTLSFDIIDPDSGGEFGGVIVFVSYPDGTTDVIHDGDTFRQPFTASPNNRIAITNGFRYTVRPSGGWKQTPTIEYIALDKGGNLGQVV